MLLPVQSVGVMGDEPHLRRRHRPACGADQDFMTADWAELPYELLQEVSTRIINEVRGRQPRGLRHQQQAAGHDRVGVRVSRQSTNVLLNQELWISINYP